MTQYKLVSKRVGSRSTIDIFLEATAKFQKEVYVEMAHEIVNRSPVDTGTFVTSHSIARRSGSFPNRVKEKSHGKPRGVDPGPKKAEGLAKLLEDINALPDGATGIVIQNVSFHAAIVERKHYVFRAVQRNAPNIIRDVAARFDMLPRGAGN